MKPKIATKEGGLQILILKTARLQIRQSGIKKQRKSYVMNPKIVTKESGFQIPVRPGHPGGLMLKTARLQIRQSGVRKKINCIIELCLYIYI